MRIHGRLLKYFKLLVIRLLNTLNRDFSYLIYSQTFIGNPIKLLLPSSTDIYLFGIKSHNSEIRLTKFLLKQLESKSVFIDIGSHIGFYSVLASHFIKQGHIHSIEASSNTYPILNQNCKFIDTITSYNFATSHENKYGVFCEFPIRYSEYNCIDASQFSHAKWFRQLEYVEHQVQYKRMDDFLNSHSIKPTLIKIDIEGSELDTIKGMPNTLKTNTQLLIIMEFVNDYRSNDNYYAAAYLLQDSDFHPHSINANGEIVRINSIKSFFDNRNIDSENLVFKRLQT